MNPAEYAASLLAQLKGIEDRCHEFRARLVVEAIEGFTGDQVPPEELADWMRAAGFAAGEILSRAFTLRDSIVPAFQTPFGTTPKTSESVPGEDQPPPFAGQVAELREALASVIGTAKLLEQALQHAVPRRFADVALGSLAIQAASQARAIEAIANDCLQLPPPEPPDKR